jgi:DDE superfamily endonuclease/Helix-turn-helix of DDE superfamily endonuclease
MLLMTLVYLRCAFSFDFLAQLFGVSGNTARSIVRTTLEIMDRRVVPLYIRMPNLRASDCPGDAQHPDIKLVIDTTCIPHTKCQTPPLNKRYFYHKSPTKYGVKVQVVIDMRNQIVHVADAVPGADHDLTIARRSGIISFLGDDVKMLGDKAYVGERFIVTPKKKPRGRELTSDELAANRVLHATRAAIEQVNKRLKDFHQMRDVSMLSPTDLEMHSLIARVCAALTNMLMLEQPIVAKYVVPDPEL